MLLVNLEGRNGLGGLVLDTQMILKCVFKKEGVRHFTLLNVEGLQTAFHLSRSRALALTLFHSIPHSFRILCIPSSHVYRGLPLGFFPCVLACQPILGYLSSPILTTYPNNLNCANSIISLRQIIFNPILIRCEA